MRIKANGITFNYEVDGPEGAPWLMFSNSLATTLAMWDGQASAFGKSFRVLRYDQRGHGATEAPAGSYTFDLLVDDVIALLDALSSARRISPASPWAASPPWGSRCAIPTGSTARSSATRRARRRRRPPSNGTSASPSPARRGWRPWSSRPSAAGFPGDSGRQATLYRPGAADDPHHTGERLHRLRGGARRPRFPLQGRQRDAPGPVHRRREGRHHAARHARDARDAARLAVRAMPGAGHISNLDRPEEFNAAIRDFLAA